MSPTPASTAPERSPSHLATGRCAGRTAARSKPPTFVSLLDGGQIVVVNPDRGQQATDLSHLAAKLYENVGTEAAHHSILIRANRTVRYGEFMAVVNQLQADGLYNVALITEGNGATS